MSTMPARTDTKTSIPCAAGRFAVRLAVLRHQAGDEGDERGGRTVDLVLRPAERTPDRARERAGDDPLLGTQAHRHREAHRHRDGGERDDEAGAEVTIGGLLPRLLFEVLEATVEEGEEEPKATGKVGGRVRRLGRGGHDAVRCEALGAKIGDGRGRSRAGSPPATTSP